MSDPRCIVVTTATVLEVDGPAPARDLASLYFHTGKRELHLRGTTARVIGRTLVDTREQEPQA